MIASVRKSLLPILGFASVIMACSAAIGQPTGYPTKTMTYVVPYPAGGAAEVFARVSAPPMHEVIGLAAAMNILNLDRDAPDDGAAGSAR